MRISDCLQFVLNSNILGSYRSFQPTEICHYWPENSFVDHSLAVSDGLCSHLQTPIKTRWNPIKHLYFSFPISMFSSLTVYILVFVYCSDEHYA